MAGKGKAKRLLTGLGGVVLSLIAAAAVYLAAVMLQSPGARPQENAAPEKTRPPVTRMQAAAMDDASAMARMFECRLPALPGLTPKGRGVNASHDGEPARLVTLSYNGAVISAVQPASAAPLLLRGELDVTLRGDLTVLNLPAVLAERGRARCLYFSDEAAAYSLYAPEAEEEEFLALAAGLHWVEP